MGPGFNLIYELQETAKDYHWLCKADLQIPSIEIINNLFEKKNQENSLDKLKFVTQEALTRRQAEKFRQELKKRKTNRLLNYVDSILEKQEILTRKNNLHDFCNSIVWARFPKSKWVLCEIFRNAMPESFSLNGRSELQNFLTCFDEGGIIITTPNKCYKNVIQQLHSAKNHDAYMDIQEEIQCYFFGHGLMEQVRVQKKEYYTSCCVLSFDEGFFSLDSKQKSRFIDLELAKNLLMLNKDFSLTKKNSWTHFFLACDFEVSGLADNLPLDSDFNLDVNSKSKSSFL